MCERFDFTYHLIENEILNLLMLLLTMRNNVVAKAQININNIIFKTLIYKISINIKHLYDKNVLKVILLKRNKATEF